MNRSCETRPACRDPKRRGDIVEHPMLNGIDFVQYEHRPAAVHPHVLVVTFIKPLPRPPQSDPDGAYGLTTHIERIRVDGGTRIVDIRVLACVLAGTRLEIAVDKAGDFSSYRLGLGWVRQPDGSWQQTISALDPRFSLAAFSFKAECPTEFDCRQEAICPPRPEDAPLLDYLAKDYRSFRQLLLDLIAQRNPDWIERNPADLGIALVELLAYAGDHLSYFQDAVANEAFLETARQRVSVKRHARLIDYRMHDGRNAWAYLHIQCASAGTVAQGTRILSRVADPLRGQTTPPGTVIQEVLLSDDTFEADPALCRSKVFETAFPIDVHPENNEIRLHTWGDLECCLPAGATSAHVYALDPVDADRVVRPFLKAGDYLLFEEVEGPETGSPADADPERRQAVRLTAVREDDDPVYRDRLLHGMLQLREALEPAMPLLKITWDPAEALGFALCVSTKLPDQQLRPMVSVARGNIVLADHGRTVVEPHAPEVPTAADRIMRLRLKRGPLTMQCQPDTVTYRIEGGAAVLETPRSGLTGDARQARPAVAVVTTAATGDEIWTPVPDLLDSHAFHRHFVVDVDHAGNGELRFGDSQYGRRPVGGTSFQVSYRIGNGRAGNVGAEALAHVVQPAVAPAWPAITAVRNPLPASAGLDPETMDEVRQKAPAAFRAEQFRAVTEADYRDAALKMAEIAGAMAAFRWTGSWHTVVIAIDPRNPQDLVTLPGGRTRLETAFRERVKAHIARYRLAGYDLELRSAEYVPVEIDLLVCVKPDHFTGDVLEAVSRALSNRINPDGSRGHFHPHRFTFGQAVHLSALYATVEAVAGVDSAVVTRFRVCGQPDNGELDAGAIPVGPWQIARLDNDPNFEENGVLRLSAGGGK